MAVRQVQLKSQADCRSSRFRSGRIGENFRPCRISEGKGEKVEIFQRSVLKNTTWPLPGEKPTRESEGFSIWGKRGRSRTIFLVVELMGNTVRDRTFPMFLTLALPSESIFIVYTTCHYTENVTLESNKRLW